MQRIAGAINPTKFLDRYAQRFAFLLENGNNNSNNRKTPRRVHGHAFHATECVGKPETENDRAKTVYDARTIKASQQNIGGRAAKRLTCGRSYGNKTPPQLRAVVRARVSAAGLGITRSNAAQNPGHGRTGCGRSGSGDARLG